MSYPSQQKMKTSQFIILYELQSPTFPECLYSSALNQLKESMKENSQLWNSSSVVVFGVEKNRNDRIRWLFMKSKPSAKCHVRTAVG